MRAALKFRRHLNNIGSLPWHPADADRFRTECVSQDPRSLLRNVLS